MSDGGADAFVLVVAEDGNIPADQIAKLGVGPGTHLRVVIQEPVEERETIGGRLTGWADITWEDFERGSQLAISDLGGR